MSLRSWPPRSRSRPGWSPPRKVDREYAGEFGGPADRPLATATLSAEPGSALVVAVPGAGG
ncbi:hypothetical protein O7627_09090 [Solwaraspora sp. WMMD1047]|uniref:hypothetical protein n=1 Tax=Solwaraspora sp. WMMD1047 TaxID=3016102 RepID=UPI0024177512|nr:hypothetical protein [Solwaraspora sp. WMMD1047]MDG4829455.1 hypothetical protein [Solwaraspora sp. WMMD1047]